MTETFKIYNCADCGKQTFYAADGIPMCAGCEMEELKAQLADREARLAAVEEDRQDLQQQCLEWMGKASHFAKRLLKIQVWADGHGPAGVKFDELDTIDLPTALSLAGWEMSSEWGPVAVIKKKEADDV